LVGVNKEEFDGMRMHGMEYFKIIDAQQTTIRKPNINYLKQKQQCGSPRSVEAVN
jgi:hypothetical protein